MISGKLTAAWIRDQSEGDATVRLLALSQVGYLLLVLLWGAVVRATGSGAGCGSHWPLCNGDIIPLAPSLKTSIEFAHRVTSGLALPLSFLVIWFHQRRFPVGHRARFAAWATFFFLLIEAALGAMLVILEHVADNPSMYRAISTSLHLVNTFLLMAFANLCYLWTKHGEDEGYAVAKPLRTASLVGAVGLIVVGAVGAVTALGDTLFPVTNHGDAISASWSSGQIFLVRLRILHPIAAILCSGYLVWVWHRLSQGWLRQPDLSIIFVAILLAQIFVGFLNIEFFAPLALQLAHLLLAHLLWLVYITMMNRCRIFG